MELQRENKKLARKAGWLYVLMAVSGGFGIMYIPENILVPHNAASTAENIRSSVLLFNFSTLSSLICQVSFIFLALTLHKLLKEVKPQLSRLMVVLVLTSVPISILNLINRFAAQRMAMGSEFAQISGTEQSDVLSMLFIEIHEYGVMMSEVFWGFWLLPFGLLVIKSKFIPRMIGYLLLMGGSGYLLESMVGIIDPGVREVILPYMAIPLTLSELSVILWLLIKGVKQEVKTISS